MEETDSQIVARVRAGDREAYRVLVERHSRGVFKLAYRMMGNESDAEDVVQEAFLRAFRNLRQFDETASFSTWLYRIAANHALDSLRMRKRHGRHEQVDSEEFSTTAAAAGAEPWPDRIAYSGQVSVRVRSAMNTLTEQERSAFVLRHFEGCSIEEIAGTLGLAQSAAKHSVFRAVQKLRRALEPVVGAVRGTS